MKHSGFHGSTRRVLAILITIFVAVLAIAHFRAAASGSISSTSAQQDVITLRAENPDQPWIKISSRTLATNTRDALSQTDSSSLNSVRPLSLASDDFNGDGFPDLVCGYASRQGGLLTIYRGNPEAYSPHDPEVLRGIGRAQF